MPLLAGSRLGPYEIESPLGAGAMGEVYRARDTRLGRTVALKLLPPELANDPQFRDRFDREARLISGLDHPHICALYDVGNDNGLAYLVMQYLEGKTLAEWIATERERVERRSLLATILRTAEQIADALDHAHSHGIVHRDLKPGNVMLTSAGVKLVDFGLAKVARPPVAWGATELSTQQAPMTTTGTILGTPPYMAPEQLEGKEADTRSDVWAFGCLLYELVIGRRPFEGKSTPDLIAAIVAGDVVFASEVESVVPESLKHLIRRCLAKSPGDRWSSGRDLAIELRWIAGLGPAAAPPQPATRRWLGPLLGGVAVATAAIVIALWTIREKVPSPRRLSILVPQTTSFTVTGLPNALAISPDSSTVIHVTWRDGRPGLLHRRPINAFDSTPLAGTEGAVAPFFSPDGYWVGFLVGSELKKVAASGGPVVSLASTVENPGQAFWARDNRVITVDGSGISEVSTSGGRPRLLVPIDKSAGEIAFNTPSVLPDGHTILFAVRRTMGGWNNAQIVAHDVQKWTTNGSARRRIRTSLCAERPSRVCALGVAVCRIVQRVAADD